MNEIRGKIIETLKPDDPPKLDAWLIVRLVRGKYRRWECGSLASKEKAQYVLKHMDEDRHVRLVHITEEPDTELVERDVEIVRLKNEVNRLKAQITDLAALRRDDP